MSFQQNGGTRDSGKARARERFAGNLLAKSKVYAFSEGECGMSRFNPASVCVVCTVRDKTSQNVSEARERLPFFPEGGCAMSRFNCALLSLVVVCVLSLAAITQASTIGIPVPNGDFSSPATSSYIINTVPTSWTDTEVGGGGVAVGGYSGRYFFQGISGNDTACLYQSDIGANFVQGDTYTLDFYYNSTGAYTLTAMHPLQWGTSLATQPISVAASQGWTEGSVSGIATSTTSGAIGVSFMFQTPNVVGNWQPGLDSVTLTQTSPIPEPSAVVLLATALIGLLAYAWRRRR